MARSAAKGAATSINAAVNPEFANGKALFFESCKPAGVNSLARCAVCIDESSSYRRSLSLRGPETRLVTKSYGRTVSSYCASTSTTSAPLS